MVNSAKRAAFACASLAELQELLNARYRHLVVDDKPHCAGRLLGVVPNRLTRKLPNLAYYGAARKIYTLHRNVEFLQGNGRSSISALRLAAARAKELGSAYVFIHLDDNAYARTLPSLLADSIAAMDAHEQVSVVRLSAYPILSGDCDRERGNTTLITRADDSVRFDSVVLRPQRSTAFTLWCAPWEASTADGRFWPVILWNAVYKVDFLLWLLSSEAAARLANLGAVEAWYKSSWKAVWRHMPGAFGFINMQFAGLERERNLNWRELIDLPNTPIL
jgi:hypothetical protein